MTANDASTGSCIIGYSSTTSSTNISHRAFIGTDLNDYDIDKARMLASTNIVVMDSIGNFRYDPKSEEIKKKKIYPNLLETPERRRRQSKKVISLRESDFIEYDEKKDCLLIMSNGLSQYDYFINFVGNYQRINILYDKNLQLVDITKVPHTGMNRAAPLIIDYISLNTKQVHIKNSHITAITKEVGVVKIDLNKFFSDKDRKIVIKEKKGTVSYEKLLEVKRDIKKIDSLIISSLQYLRETTAHIYDESDFDIIVEPDYISNCSTLKKGGKCFFRFQIMVKIDNITIHNSLEMSKEIGTMIMYMPGYIRVSEDNLNDLVINIADGIKGCRTTWTYNDIQSGYIHSHLPSDANKYLNYFCLGNESIFRTYDDVNLTQLDIQLLLEHLKLIATWESLEGGPHRKMEDSDINRSNAYKYSKSSYNDNIHSDMETINKQFDYVINRYQVLKEELKDCIVLTKVNAYEYAFKADFVKLIGLFHNISKRIKDRKSPANVVKLYYDYFTYQYDYSSGKFYNINRSLSSSVEDMINDSNYKIKSNFKPYFQGNLITNIMTDADKIDQYINNVTKVPNPLLIKFYGSYIERKLNIKLNESIQ